MRTRWRIVKRPGSYDYCEYYDVESRTFFLGFSLGWSRERTYLSLEEAEHYIDKQIQRECEGPEVVKEYV